MKIKLIFLIIVNVTPWIRMPAQSPATFQVRIVTADLVYNNHVGNEWSYQLDLSINDETYRISRTSTIIIIPKGSELKLTAEVKEFDKYSDYGENSRFIDASDLYANTRFEVPIEVQVVENAGRYEGNQALWKFSILFSR